MTADHYATLGVSPTASPAAIRAAYLALMREHHPDRNASPAALERAQAIIAAFKVLGDFDQRNHYDWDRRREREAAAAAVARRPARIGAGAVAAGAIGLAAVGALFLMPRPQPEPVAPPLNEVSEAPAAKARPIARPTRVADPSPADSMLEPPPPLEPPFEPGPEAAIEPIRETKREPVPVARIEPVRLARIEPARLARIAGAAERPAGAGAVAKRLAPALPAPARAREIARPVRKGAGTSTEIASLDQFVMSFYGQSWRFGDPPRRKVLERTRAGFVARRGACTADPCKRAAYLDLMRDVSQIVETGEPAR